MEENKNYTEPEQIERAEEVVSEEPQEIEESKTQSAKPAEVAKSGDKKPVNKKMWIIIGAAVLALAVVAVLVIWLIGGNNPPEDPTPEETTVAGKWYPAESMEDSPLDADPKQEDVFYD